MVFLQSGMVFLQMNFLPDTVGERRESIMKYNIQGDNLPVVICELDANESMITERGAMAWMSPNMRMETKTSGIGKGMGRMFSGDSFFQNIYTAQGGNGMIAFASCFPGKIIPFQVGAGQEYILQKRAFLASEAGVKLSVHFRKKIGIVFAEFDGSIVEYELAAGQKIVVDTGNLAAMSASCQMDIQTVPGVKNVLFGGEGLFNTVVTGPGHVWLQTMPISSVANSLRPYLPSGNN